MSFPPFDDDQHAFNPFQNGAGLPQMPSGFGAGQDPLAQVPQDFDGPQGISFDEQTPNEMYSLVNGEMQEVPDIDELSAENPPGFNENLVERYMEVLGEDECLKLGRRIVEDTESDIEARQPWTDRFKRGMEMMGLITSEMDDGPFPGSSSAVHPLISEAVVQFWARAMGEQVPSDGPAKAKVNGKQTEDAIGKAGRVADYLNHEMLFVDDGWYPEHSRSMFAVPFQGCVFKKVYHDASMCRNTSIMVAAEDFIAPAGITDLKSTPRYAHRLWRSDDDIAAAVASKMYREVDLGEAPQEDLPEETAIKLEITDQGEGEDDNQGNEWELYESYYKCVIPTEVDQESTGLALPYVITVEKTTGKILSIYRGWKKADPLKRRRVLFVKYGYVPGFGLYDLGLFHLMGGLQQAATGALRALLDGAATSSLQGGFVAKDANMKDQRLEIEPGVWKPLDATSEELNKAFFTPPFKEPSPALFQLLEFLTDRGEKFTSTTEIMTGETNAKAPVGSVVAVIEQGAKVFSTIHRGLHMAMAQELRLRFELVQEHMPQEGYPYDIEGAHEGVMAEDFAPGVSIQPVSDPNIFSSAQRVAINQAAYQVCQENPDLMERKEGIRRLLEGIRVPDVDKLFKANKPPPPMDPVSEIQALLRGEPVQAYPDQLHEAYLQHYAAFLSNPQFGGNPEVQKQIGPTAMALVGQRLAYAWATAARMLGAPAPLLPPQMGVPGPDGTVQQPNGDGNGNGGPPQLPPPGPQGGPQGPMGQPPTGMGQMGQPPLGGPPQMGGMGGPGMGQPPVPANAPPEVIAKMAAQIAPQMASVAGLPPIDNGEKDDKAAELELKKQEMQLKAQGQQVELQFKAQSHAQEMEHDKQKFGFEMQKEAAKTQAELEKTKLQMQSDQVKSQIDVESAVADATLNREQKMQQMVSDAATAEQDRAIDQNQMLQDEQAGDQEMAQKEEDAALNRVIRTKESKSKQEAQKAQAKKPKAKD